MTEFPQMTVLITKFTKKSTRIRLPVWFSGMLGHCCHVLSCSASVGDFSVPIRVPKSPMLMHRILW